MQCRTLRFNSERRRCRWATLVCGNSVPPRAAAPRVRPVSAPPASTGRGFRPAFGAGSRRIGGLMIQRLDRIGFAGLDLGRVDLGAVVLGHALLEGLYALG